MIKILICDDHAIVRQGLRQILEDCNDITIAGEAECGEELIRMVDKDDIDVIVLDITMDGIGGIEALKEIKFRKPELAILMLSIHPEDQYAIRVLKAGASGYLTKKSAPDELVQAIRTVAKGKKYITASVSDKLISSLNADKDTLPHQLLSDREFQVLVGLAQGRSLSEIADNLCLSGKTVSTYRTRLLDKMDIKTNADMVRYCIQHKLIE